MLGERFAAVLRAAVDGDAAAFAELWRATHPMLLRYLRGTCGDAAEDVASEAWLKAIAALGTFRGEETDFRGWLVVIARNHARDTARRAARRPESPAGDLTVRLAETSATAADVAEAAIERRGTDAALRLVRTLPPDQAELVLLRVIVGLDVADVARITGRSPGAVRVAVHRALRTLAGRLREGREAAVTRSGEEALIRRDA